MVTAETNFLSTGLVGFVARLLIRLLHNIEPCVHGKDGKYHPRLNRGHVPWWLPDAAFQNSTSFPLCHIYFVVCPELVSSKEAKTRKEVQRIGYFASCGNRRENKLLMIWKTSPRWQQQHDERHRWLCCKAETKSIPIMWSYWNDKDAFPTIHTRFRYETPRSSFPFRISCISVVEVSWKWNRIQTFHNSKIFLSIWCISEPTRTYRYFCFITQHETRYRTWP